MFEIGTYVKHKKEDWWGFCVGEYEGDIIVQPEIEINQNGRGDHMALCSPSNLIVTGIHWVVGDIVKDKETGKLGWLVKMIKSGDHEDEDTVFNPGCLVQIDEGDCGLFINRGFPRFDFVAEGWGRLPSDQRKLKTQK